MLKISISGIRGTVPDSLTPEVCLNFSKAFGTYLNGGTVVVATDTRSSAEFLKGVALSGLISSGCKVIDLGIAATPTTGVLVRELKADGGLIITASHNPEPWNGLKFIRNDGIFLNSDQASKLIGIYETKSFIENKKGFAKTYNKANSDHVKKILKNIDVRRIRRSKFKVAIDCGNGAGSAITPMLLERLGCKIFAINTRLKSPFGRGAEPTPENIKELAELVKREGCDVGFAQDPDADRLALVTNEGIAISEEYTLALCAKYILADRSASKKLIVTNLSTTQAIDDVARERGALVIRTKIGEVYVAEVVKNLKAVIGGEGNGGVIFPKVGFNRDSLSGIALILSLLMKKKLPLSAIVQEIPKYFLVKEKFECASHDDALKFIDMTKERFKKDTVDLTEGVKVIRQYGWLHLRPSNTEPIIRVFAEAKEKHLAEEFIKEALN